MIYYKIQNIRKLKKLSIDFVASELQISVNNYLSIENGEVDVKLSKLLLIADIFCVCPTDLFYCNETNSAKKKSFNL